MAARMGFLGLTLVAACGSPATHTGDAQQTPPAPAETVDSKSPAPGPTAPSAGAYHSELVATAAALPACTPDAEGWLIYVKADKTFQACVGGKWEAADIKGEPGPPGKDGADNHITGSIFCTGSLENTAALNFDYGADEMASGDIFARAAIRGAAFQVTNVTFYSGQQVGAATAAVILTSDSTGPFDAGWWQISLDRSTLITTIVYNDTDLANGSQSWTMPPYKCVVNRY